MKTYLLSLAALPATVFAAQVNRVEYQPHVGGQGASIEITGVGLQAFQKEEKSDPPELVLTFPDARIAETVKKSLDTSAFHSNVIQVSAYPLNGAVPQVRVVIDLQKNAPFRIESSDQKISVHCQEVASKPLVVKTLSSVEETPTDAPTSIDQAAIATEQRFTGSPITLKLKDADVHDVLRLISDASGFNIVVHPAVVGKLTLSLERVPWDQALEVVLTTLKLAADRSQSVLRVMPRDMMLAEKQADLDAKKLALTAAPRITRIFPISYQDPATLSSVLTSFAAAQNTGTNSSSIPTSIIVDANTQSLIVRDTAENIERIRKMIQLLDVQTPQVLIEGKVIEASSGFSNDINGQIGEAGGTVGAAFNGLSPLLGTTSLGQFGGAQTGTLAMTSGISLFGNPIALNALLSMGEKENTAKVVSSPRSVVLSGKTANITQTTSVAVDSSVQTATSTTTSLQTVSASTKLSVTPRVTNDGSVFMKLDLSRDILNLTDSKHPTTNPRNMNTEVIVDSGTTLVIGGILNLDENHASIGVPWLRKIPIFGWLFEEETNSFAKSEIMFFVTPRVLNPRRSGALLTDDTQSEKPSAEKL